MKTNNWIRALDINAHNEQCCTRIEPALLFSAAGLKQRAKAIRPGRHFSSWNNGKYYFFHFFSIGMPIYKVFCKILNKFHWYWCLTLKQRFEFFSLSAILRKGQTLNWIYMIQNTYLKISSFIIKLRLTENVGTHFVLTFRIQ